MQPTDLEHIVLLGEWLRENPGQTPQDIMREFGWSNSETESAIHTLTYYGYLYEDEDRTLAGRPRPVYFFDYWFDRRLKSF